MKSTRFCIFTHFFTQVTQQEQICPAFIALLSELTARPHCDSWTPTAFRKILIQVLSPLLVWNMSRNPWGARLCSTQTSAQLANISTAFFCAPQQLIYNMCQQYSIENNSCTTVLVSAAQRVPEMRYEDGTKLKQVLVPI